MIIKTNIETVTQNITARLSLLRDKERLLRPLCFGVIDLMTKRIHIDGKASDGSLIGTYSKSYMALRTGNYGNSERFAKGAQKGKNKNAGVFTKKSANAGTARPNFHRSADTKVIVSLTRQLENDWSVIALPNGYGVGFLNSFNFQKARWTEANYKKAIFSLSNEETEYVTETLNQMVEAAFS